MYKCGLLDAKSWEEGISTVFVTAFNFFYEEITGKMCSEKAINTALLFNNEEVLELTRRLDGHPYDTTTLASYECANGIAWFDIRAVGLASAYRDTDYKQRQRIAYHIIQNFFMETRGVQVYVDVKIATSTRLYFAVPLSVEGEKYLQRQKPLATIEESPVRKVEPMEEEIPLFDDPKDGDMENGS